ncbi:MAG: PP2C family protein-serine/threonine phosphatase [Phycisphaerales bacterium]
MNTIATLPVAVDTAEGFLHVPPHGSHAIERQVYEHILRVSRRLASTSDLGEVLGVIIDALRDLLGADRASVFQYDAKRHELFATKAHGLPSDLRLPADKGIIGEAARTRQIVNIPDAYADARFNRAVDTSTGYRTRCLLTIPLIDFEGRLAGVAQVLNKHPDQGGVFDADDEMIAMHLADQAAAALNRSVLLEERRQKEKYAAALQGARAIQLATLPASLPEIPGYDIAGHSFPADETGGDAYDVILRKPSVCIVGDQPIRTSGALLFMADATGHGIGPALSVTQVLAMLRIACRMDAEVDHAAFEINAQLCNDLPAGRFVTAFLGNLDAGRHELTYVSAGQAPLMFMRADANAPDALFETHANAMPFGIDPNFCFDYVPEFRFEPGDVFVLLSDGYYEAFAPSGAMFGTGGVAKVVRANIHRSSAEILDEIRAEVVRFTHGQPAVDDQTALIVKRVG